MPLLSVAVEHPYYNGNHTHILSFSPSVACNHLLHNMQAMIKPHSNGFELLYDSEQYPQPENLLETFADETLVFIGLPDDAENFYTITQGFQPATAGIYLFTNDQSLTPLNGTYTPLDEWQAEAIEKVHMSRMPSAFCPVVLSLDTTALKDQITGAAEPRIQLCFSATQSHFKYYLTMNHELQQPQIVDKAEAHEFSHDREEIRPGQTVDIFVSKQAIDARQDQALRLQLVDTASERTKVVIDPLPLPKPGAYNRHTLEGQEVMVSEVFIN